MLARALSVNTWIFCLGTHLPGSGLSCQGRSGASFPKPSGEQKNLHPSGEQKNLHPSGEQKNLHPSGEQKNLHPSGEQKNLHPSREQRGRGRGRSGISGTVCIKT